MSDYASRHSVEKKASIQRKSMLNFTSKHWLCTSTGGGHTRRLLGWQAPLRPPSKRNIAKIIQDKKKPKKLYFHTLENENCLRFLPFREVAADTFLLLVKKKRSATLYSSQVMGVLGGLPP